MKNSSFLGIDLGGTKMLLLGGEIQKKIPTGKSFTRDDLKQAILDFIQMNQLKIQAVGIAVPGLVQQNQLIACDVLPLLNGFSPEKDWQDFPFQILLSNDIKAALTQEFGEKDASFSGGVILVGTGIGAALISEGKPVLGADGWAGELGYFPMMHNGHVKRLDELSGGQYMADRLGLTALEMVQKAQEGESGVLQIIREGGFTLGLALAGLINLFNPVELALGGGTLRLPGYWEAMTEPLEKQVIPEFWRPGMVRKVWAGEQVVALGAIKRIQLELSSNH